MTEQDWMNTTDPLAKLKFLRTSSKLSGRKARLFACACCRRIWRLLTEEESRESVEATEKFADGLVTAEELSTAYRNAQDAQEMLHRAEWNTEAKVNFQFTYEYQLVRAQHLASIVASRIAAPFNGRDWSEYLIADSVQSAIEAAGLAPELFDLQIGLAAYVTALKDEGNWCKTATERLRDAREAADAATRRASQDAEQLQQGRLLHDVFGPWPFREIRIDPRWLTWNDDAVVKLAQAIYAERELPSGILDSSRLAVLADALEEAGCSDEILLRHLRGPEPHVRGCWVIDLLLKKN